MKPKPPRRISRCLPSFDALEGRSLLSHFGNPGSPPSAPRDSSPPSSVDCAPDGSGGRSKDIHDARGGWRPTVEMVRSSPYGGSASPATTLPSPPPAARSDLLVAAPDPQAEVHASRPAVALIIVQPTPTSAARGLRSARSSTLPGSSGGAVDTSSAESPSPSPSQDVLFLAALATLTTATIVPVAPEPGEALSLIPVPARGPASVGPASQAPLPAPPGSPIGPQHARPTEPTHPVPEANPSTVPATGDAASSDATRGASTDDVPPPRGADLITETGPLDGKTIDESLAELLDRFGGLGEELSEQVRGTSSILPIILSVGAFEAARRWRRRRAASACPPARYPRRFQPGGLI